MGLAESPSAWVCDASGVHSGRHRVTEEAAAAVMAEGALTALTAKFVGHRGGGGGSEGCVQPATDRLTE